MKSILKIDNILERIKRNPEPIEVTEGRNKIIESFKDIEFIEDVHKYFLPQPDGTKKELTSVTTIIEQKFVPYVDWDEKAELKALKLGIPAEELKEEWLYTNHLATTSGSIHHEYAEMLGHLCQGHPEEINDRFKMQYECGYLFPACPKQEAALKFHEDLFAIDSIYPVLEEARVYNEELGYSGTFDKLIYFKHPTDDEKSGFIIVDYKTNASLTNGYARENGQRMLPPFNDMIDEAYNHYICQLSAYQIPMEDIGLKVIARRLIWLKPDGTYEKYNLPDVTDKLRKALKTN
jgi:hypothetical protein